MAAVAQIMANIKRDHLYKLMDEGQRVDGRGLNDFRKTSIVKGLIDTAEGSAMVTMGDTRLLAGVKMLLGEPYPDSFDKGVMTTNVELTPIGHALFEAGPPREHAIELSRVTDRGIRESGAIDLKNLCIEPHKKVWIVFIDIHILDHDGNLFDAASLAAMAALTCTMVPAAKHELGEDYPLPLTCMPLTCTSALINNKLVVDPTYEEEQVMEGRLTVSTDEKGILRAMQKGHGGAFSPELVKEAVKHATERTAPLRKLLEEAK